jgi:hypothetical protein
MHRYLPLPDLLYALQILLIIRGFKVQEKITPHPGRLCSFRYRLDHKYHVRYYTLQTVINSDMRNLG